MLTSLPWTHVQPVVLVGGRSRRFGRDKLREPLGDGWLVDRPVAVLRAVFGARIAMVGECHETVRSRADSEIPDRYPGAGPAGGILSALEGSGRDVFVLAGDLPSITPAVVEAILARAAAGPEALAVLALTDRVEPCIGLYRLPCAALLRRRLQERGSTSLFDVVPSESLLTVRIGPEAAANVNTPGEFNRLNEGTGSGTAPSDLAPNLGPP